MSLTEVTTDDFLNSELSDFAVYNCIRSISSYIDGLKNSSRKVVYYLFKKKNNEEMKVFNLAGSVSIDMQYLHGDISGVITTLAKNYIGSNNIPLISREGNFGTRFSNDASAPRYIYTQKEKYFYNIFKKEDENILIHQTFEGQQIEPRFFVPTIPLVLINGSEGIATGFAQKILPRSLKDIIAYINGEKNDLIPSYKNFKGTISKGEVNNQWIISGSIKRDKNKIIIEEVPVGYDLQSYTKVLDTLEEKKIIRSYIDKSENDNFLFEINVNREFIKKSDEEILNILKLVKRVSENFTCIDENNKIIIFKNAHELLDKFINIKKEYLKKRKDYLISKMTDDLKILLSKFIFIKSILDGNLIVQKRSKNDIVEDIKKIDRIIPLNDSYDYLLNMPIYSLGSEKLNEIQNTIRTKKEELITVQNKTEDNFWKDDLKELEELKVL